MTTEFQISARGIRLYCRKCGKGDPIVMIHGACVDSDFYSETAEILSRSFSVYTYDRCGYGRSEDHRDHSISSQSEDVAALIHKIGYPCHVIAHSSGTSIAMELAFRHSNLVRKLILHEPIDANCMDQDGDAIMQLREIDTLVQQTEYNKALMKFIPLIGKKDFRAREATIEEAAHIVKNCHCFIQNEFQEAFSFRANIESLKKLDITVGIGDASRGNEHEQMAIRLAEKIGADIIWFPSAHNGPFDLPKEFAWLCTGILNV